MKVKKIDLLVIIWSVLLVHISLVNRIPLINNYTRIQWYLTIIIGVILLLQFIKYGRIKNDKFMSILIIVFALAAFITSYLNQSYGYLSVGIFNTVMIVEIFFSMRRISYMGKSNLALKTVFYCLSCYCVLNDILMFTVPSKFYGVGNFLLYSKFFIAYLHMICLTLYISLKEASIVHSKIKIRRIILAWIYCVIVCSYINCATGIIGLFVMMILGVMIYLKKDGSSVKSLKGILGTLLISNGIVLIWDFLSNLEVVKYIVVTLLHKSMDMSNRIYIYAAIHKVLELQPFWGVGAENNFFICQKYLWISAAGKEGVAPDVQNGVLDLLLSYGGIGLFCLTLIFFICMKKGEKNRCISFAVLLIAYMVMSSVEIVFDKMFFFIVASYAYFECNNYKFDNYIRQEE